MVSTSWQLLKLLLSGTLPVLPFSFSWAVASYLCPSSPKPLFSIKTLSQSAAPWQVERVCLYLSLSPAWLPRRLELAGLLPLP